MSEELLAGFAVIIEWPVAWGEMDALGHVNNAMYFRYIESGRMEYFTRAGMMDGLARNGVGPILHSVRCRFRLPLSYPDTVLIGTRVTEVGDDRFTMESKLASRRHGRVAAEAESIIVNLDYTANRKAVLSAELRNRLAELEGRK